MGRYVPTREAQVKRRQLNPIWRGIGCLTIVGLAAAGYLFANWFLPANFQNGWIYLPPELSGPPQYPWLYVKATVGVLAGVAGFAILTMIYGILNPMRPGELDAPPEKRRVKRSR